MSDDRLTELIDRAFDYRGYVTVSRHDGSKLVGFIYDRNPAQVEMFDEHASRRIRVRVDEIANVELTGEDAAAKAQLIWERRKGALEPPETSAWGDWEAERPALILVALPLELRGVARVFGAKRIRGAGSLTAGRGAGSLTVGRGAVVRGTLGDHSAVAYAIGVGGGAADVIAAERPRLVISCGFAGALATQLASGDIVLASSVRDESGESFQVSRLLLRAAGHALRATGQATVAEGEILCTTRVAITADEKRFLARPGRLAVDLESGPVARAAERAGIPWLALRVILDPVEVDLPAFTREAHETYLGPALRHALGGPQAVLELARLGLRARVATRSLEWALRCLGPTLGAARHESIP